MKITRIFVKSWRLAKRHKKKLAGLFVVLLIAYYFCLPNQLFNDPTSTVLFDKDGELLGAKIASDGQWRFPPLDTVPEKFKHAILTFEDKRFYSHWGVDPLAMSRAIYSNVSQGRRVSGASTLTMQVMRLSRKNKHRTIFEKIKETILATRLEWSYSKDEILAFYASYAPFGGNVVGLDAAAWKYFGRSPKNLSWAESAMLAVLPNSPSLIHLSKNREKLMSKRNRLLDLMLEEAILDSVTCELAKLEPLPEKPKPLPMLAPHLLERVHRHDVLAGRLSSGIVSSTLDATLQIQATAVVNRHNERLKNNQIHNAAALIIDATTGNVLAYIGNAPNAGDQHGSAVDIITAPRSSGSILKPFLYATLLHDGEMLPRMLFPDVPTQFGGYTPENYDETYSGAVRADQVIARSLNIPSIHMLHQYSIERFYAKLQQTGMTSLRYAPQHYGLTLILGGAETKLWDLGAMYSGMVRNLTQYYNYDGNYDPQAFRPLNYLKENTHFPLQDEDETLSKQTPLRASAIWHTFEAMQQVIRPGEESFWENFTSSSRIAWKTGTSFGFRDAWAVGCTPKYVVAVWAGNADGEGRPGLVGVRAAAPILFDIFEILGRSNDWFERPYDEMTQRPICRHSGHIAGQYCDPVDTLWIPKKGTKTNVCPYHQSILLDKTAQYRVHSDCESPFNSQKTNFFVLPPAQEWFYKKKHPSYQLVPPFREDCKGNAPQQKRSMALIYPYPDMKIYVPVNLDESRSKTVFEATHAQPNSTIHWHLDDNYIGSSTHFHEIALNPPVGKHLLTLVDEEGETIQRSFEILAKVD